MNNHIQFHDDATIESSASVSKSFVSNVFSYMTLALLISGGVAAYFGLNESLFLSLMSVPGMMWILMLAPLAFVMIISFGFNKLSFPALLVIFLAYAATMGLSLSAIFVIFDLGVIFKVFLITAGLFGTMAVLGYTTKTDLTAFGGILTMALIGIVIASLVNMFMGSETMDYIISCIGVLVFTGLTAYDVQKIKRIGAGVEYGTATASKLALMGALSLYLDFVNLFMFLLRIFGRSSE
ncbi:MAG: Bax inhibitor-1/YccA family protein [Bacteroidota bacterium]|jgi:FtsH-binding integral membrane protein|nr:Bax inhibitor-1/YccA family protein [Bacteroidota bacterium]